MSKATIVICVREEADRTYLAKEMELPFAPVIGDVFRPLAPYAGENDISSLLELKVQEHFFDYNGTLHVGLDTILVNPTYEARAMFEAQRIPYFSWSVLKGDVVEYLEESGWMNLGNER